MSEKINLGRQGFERAAFQNAVDTSFTQLIAPPPPVADEITVEEFFDLYNELFYEIPAEGDINSHRFMINRSTEYIGATEEKEEDIQILLDEITQLREELLATQKELLSTQTTASAQDVEILSEQFVPGTQITPQPTVV